MNSVPITVKSSIKNSKKSGIKTVIFYCFGKVLIRHLSRKLYDVFSEKAPYFIAQIPMVSKVKATFAGSRKKHISQS